MLHHQLRAHHMMRLREIRTTQGLTLRELGVRARIHFTRIHQLERGIQPRDGEAERLAAALGVAIRSLSHPPVRRSNGRKGGR
jgi:transcriptional regulator with XRE-family HTH domain